MALSEPGVEIHHGMDHGHPVAATLLTRSDGDALPMALFFAGAFAAQTQDRALGHQGLDAGNAQLYCFFYQPVHALVGGHADGQMHSVGVFTFNGVVLANLDLHIAAPHLGHRGIKLSALVLVPSLPIGAVVKEGDRVPWLQTQHLHMPRRSCWQLQSEAGLQRGRAVKAGHVSGKLKGLFGGIQTRVR